MGSEFFYDKVRRLNERSFGIDKKWLRRVEHENWPSVLLDTENRATIILIFVDST
jgi:hypothetical protein